MFRFLVFFWLRGNFSSLNRDLPNLQVRFSEVVLLDQDPATKVM